jgi:ABC-type polysaccharide/polyol phosphate export permease
MDEQKIKAFEDKINSLHGLSALLRENPLLKGSKPFNVYPILHLMESACNFLIMNLVIIIEQLRKQ